MKKTAVILLLTLACWGVLNVPALAAVVINEILVNAPGTDDNREFIELRNTAGAGSATGLWLLQINGNSTTNCGLVDEAWNLAGLSFGANGLLLLGNNYDDAPVGGPWAAYVAPATGFGDPTGFGSGDLNNATYTWLLVANFSGAVGGDVDVNNDGIIDTAPWTSLIDSVGWDDGDTGDLVYSAAALEQSSGTPDGASRFPDETASHLKTAWYTGDIVTNATDLLGRTFDEVRVSANMPAGGVLTPGRANYAATLSTYNIRINEVLLNPGGTDDDREFLELASMLGGHETLNGLWLLVIDSAGASVGEVLDAWNLSGLYTGDNGLIILGNSYGGSNTGPWSNHIAVATVTDEPTADGSSGWGDGDIADNDDFTLMLVMQFSEDQGIDLDADDDMTLDMIPWDGIVDSVGLGQTYASAGLSPGFSPDAIGRFVGKGLGNDATAWYGAEIEGTNVSVMFEGTSTYRLPPGARLTPGDVNYPRVADSDYDGMPDSWELANFGNITSTTATADNDTDGSPNLSEYIAGTSPTNGNDFLAVTTFVRDWSHSAALLSWNSVTGRSYSVNYQTNMLSPDAWVRLMQAPGAGGSMTYTNYDIPLSAQFLRVGVRVP